MKEGDAPIGAGEIMDRKKANWILKQKALIQAQREVLKTNYERRLALLDERERGIDYKYGSALKNWAQMNFERGKKFVQLDYGRIQFRKGGDRLKIKDEVVFKAWLKGEKEYKAYLHEITVKEERIDRDVLVTLKEKYIVPDSNGELVLMGVIPGVEFEPPDEKMSLDFK